MGIALRIDNQTSCRGKEHALLLVVVCTGAYYHRYRIARAERVRMSMEDFVFCRDCFPAPVHWARENWGRNPLHIALYLSALHSAVLDLGIILYSASTVGRESNSLEHERPRYENDGLRLAALSSHRTGFRGPIE